MGQFAGVLNQGGSFPSQPYPRHNQRHAVHAPRLIYPQCRRDKGAHPAFPAHDNACLLTHVLAPFTVEILFFRLQLHHLRRRSSFLRLASVMYHCFRNHRSSLVRLADFLIRSTARSISSRHIWVTSRASRTSLLLGNSEHDSSSTELAWLPAIVIASGPNRSDGGSP